MRSFILALASAAAVSAQSTINPNSVSNSTRDGWCSQQYYQCPAICLQVTNGSSSAALHNDCDPNTLKFYCVCENGQSPNVSEYSQTLPYFICTEWGSQCVNNCGSDNTCAYDCRANHQCGARNPTRVNATTISTTVTSGGSASSTTANNAATTKANGDVIYTGLDGSPIATAHAAATQTGNSANGRAIALQFGQAWGIITVFAGLFAGFAILL